MCMYMQKCCQMHTHLYFVFHTCPLASILCAIQTQNISFTIWASETKEEGTDIVNREHFRPFEAVMDLYHEMLHLR